MSHVTIYKILHSGQVKRVEQVSNAMAGIPHIWSSLSEKYGLKDSISSGYKELWKKFSDTSINIDDRIVLGFTFDNMWVEKKNIHRLIYSLQVFWSKWDRVFDSYEREWRYADNTIPRIWLILSNLIHEPDILGVCFQQTSASESQWEVHDVCESCHQELEDSCRPFNFKTDDTTGIGGEPWELFEGLENPQ